MERNKVIFLVSISVLMVASLVLIGIWQFMPPRESQEVARTTINPMPSAGSLPDSAAIPGLAGDPSTAAPETAITGDGTSPVAPPAVHNNQEVVIVYGGNAQYGDAQGKVITVGPGTTRPLGPGSTAPAASVAPPAEGQSAAEVKTSPAPAPASPAPVNTAATSPNPATTVAPAPARPAAPATTARATNPSPAAQAPASRGKEFWIQVLSSPNRDRVELLKSDLATRGWAGRISLKNINGVDYYRLRYGPFTLKQEADKFLGYVKAVNGLEASYIVEEYPVVAKN